MTKKLTEELILIRSRLDSLQVEDDEAAEEIKADFFTLIKVTGKFDEYLDKIKEQRFTSQDYMFNSGHFKKQQIFNSARKNLIANLDQILREIKFGVLKPELLPPPETMGIAWLVKNASRSFWLSAIMVLIFSFGVGGFVEQRYGNVNEIIKYVLHPTDQLEAAINKESNP